MFRTPGEDESFYFQRDGGSDRPMRTKKQGTWLPENRKLRISVHFKRDYVRSVLRKKLLFN
jgi:hypothetical protein